MPAISIFNPTTGQILDSLVIGSLAQAAPQLEGSGNLIFIGVADRSTEFIDLQAFTKVPRPVMLPTTTLHVPADGVSSVELALPAGTLVRYQGEETVLDGTGFNFSSPVPGSFQFEIEPAFPYQVQTVMVVADEV